MAETQKGILRIGIAHTRGRAIMPALISRFQTQYPNIEIQLFEAVNQSIYQHLLKDEIDIAIANFNNPGTELLLSDLYQEEVILLIDSRLLEKVSRLTADFSLDCSCADLWQLRHCPFLLVDTDDIAGQIGQTVISQSGFIPIVKARSSNVETLLSLCAQGVGACFCPINLVNSVLSPGEVSKFRIIHLGEHVKYMIQAGVLKTNYQWGIISEFIRTAAETMQCWGRESTTKKDQ